MSLVIEPKPFPYLVVDGLFPRDLLKDADASWPSADWSGWVPYDGAQCKRASDLTSPLPPACGELLRRMALLPFGEWFGSPGMVPDLGLYGGGGFTRWVSWTESPPTSTPTAT